MSRIFQTEVLSLFGNPEKIDRIGDRAECRSCLWADNPRAGFCHRPGIGSFGFRGSFSALKTQIHAIALKRRAMMA